MPSAPEYRDPGVDTSAKRVMLASGTEARPGLIFAAEDSKGMFRTTAGIFLSGLATPLHDDQAANKKYVDDHSGSGGVANPMTADLNAGTFNITNLGNLSGSTSTVLSFGVAGSIAGNVLGLQLSTPLLGQTGLSIYGGPSLTTQISMRDDISLIAFDAPSVGARMGSFNMPTSGTATSLSVYDFDSATVRTVVVGANDSAFPGYKLLAIGN
jgi:hypothetical protein